MRKKLPRLALILIVTFCSTGCAEMLYGVICAGGILFSSDTHKTALIWPDARVGEPYQATLHVGELLQPEFSDSERLPDGLTLSWWYKGEDVNAGPSPLVDYTRTTRDFADIYLRLEGTPTKAGKYRFSVISHYMPSMCGTGSAVHPLRLRVQ